MNTPEMEVILAKAGESILLISLAILSLVWGLVMVILGLDTYYRQSGFLAGSMLIASGIVFLFVPIAIYRLKVRNSE